MPSDEGELSLEAIYFQRRIHSHADSSSYLSHGLKVDHERLKIKKIINKMHKPTLKANWSVTEGFEDDSVWLILKIFKKI